MQLPYKHVRFCLDKAQELAEQYHLYVLNGRGYPRSVDDFLSLTTEFYQKAVDVNELDIPADNSSIRALFAVVENGYEIYLLSGMNFCWTRFVLCKELFHVFLDKEEYRNINLYEHLSEVAIKFPDHTASPNAAGICEVMAEIAAMEFLFPYSERVLQARNGETDYFAIADMYKVPQYFVEIYMSQSFMDALGAFHVD